VVLKQRDEKWFIVGQILWVNKNEGIPLGNGVHWSCENVSGSEGKTLKGATNEGGKVQAG